MARLRQVSLYLFTILALLCLSTLATEYTRFEDLPKCGQVCLRKSISYALEKADCGTSLACACRSGKYSDYIFYCLGEDKPCKEAPTYGDVLRYGAEYYCNATSDQRVRYTVEVGGAKKTLTLQALEVSSASHDTTSDTSTTTTDTSSSTKVKASTITMSTLMSASSEETSDTKHGESTRPTATSSTTSSSRTSSSHSDSTSTHSDSTSSHSDSSSSTSSSSLSDDTTSSMASETEAIPSGMIVVDASTTIMGHTVTVKYTTLVTATVNSGTGPCHVESLWRGFEENVNTVFGICIASLVGLVFLMVG